MQKARFRNARAEIGHIDFTDPKPKSTDGYIALQLHSGGRGNMQFKEIYLRDLTVR